jgi:hypothetical protein
MFPHIPQELAAQLGRTSSFLCRFEAGPPPAAAGGGAALAVAALPLAALLRPPPAANSSRYSPTSLIPLMN